MSEYGWLAFWLGLFLFLVLITLLLWVLLRWTLGVMDRQIEAHNEKARRNRTRDEGEDG